MADIALVTANRVSIVGFPERQLTLPAGEAITAGMAVRIDPSTGKFTKANGTDGTEGRVYGIATHTVVAGMALTAVKRGRMDGWDLSALNYGDPVYLSDTDGRLGTTVGSAVVQVGTVVPGLATTIGTAYDKILEVDAPDFTAGASEAAGRVIVTSELLAASVDKWIFVADQAYQVTGVREIHSVVGGSGAVVRPRKVTAAGTAAPGDAAGATVKEITAADVDLTTTINVSQSPALSATAADLLLAAGDKIGLNFGGTLTGLVGFIEIILRPVA